MIGLKITVVDEYGYLVENPDFFTSRNEIRSWIRKARAAWGSEAIISVRRTKCF